MKKIRGGKRAQQGKMWGGEPGCESASKGVLAMLRCGVLKKKFFFFFFFAGHDKKTTAGGEA